MAVIYLIDAAVIIGMLLLASVCNKLFALPGIMPIVLYIWALLFGIFICVRSASHPVDRNIFMFYYLLKRDRRRFHPIELENGRRETR